MRLTDRATAKINLTLEVLGRRPDGYHEIASLVAFAADVGDGVSLDPRRPAGVSVTGPFAQAIEGENIVARLLERLPAAAIARGHVEIEKHLPVASGIGGGSADAAAALRLLRAANTAAEGVDWDGLAAGLGADVPVCVLSRAAFMTGIGERICALSPLPGLHAVLANPLAPVPADKTAQVFRRLQAPPLTRAQSRLVPERFPDTDALLKYVASHRNDLEAPARAVVPEIGLVLDALQATPGARLVRMSGAGPTAFALFEDPGAATAAAGRITVAHPRWWVRATGLV